MALIPFDPYRHELLGRRLTVASHSDPGLVGRHGRVVEETRETLVLLPEREGRRLRVAKRNGAFALASPEGRQMVVQGRRLAYRPQDRVKKGGR